jgi:hypothetical protein
MTHYTAIDAPLAGLTVYALRFQVGVYTPPPSSRLHFPYSLERQTSSPANTDPPRPL